MRGGARWFDGQGARIAEVLNSRDRRKAELVNSIFWETRGSPVDPDLRIIMARLDIGGEVYDMHHAVDMRALTTARDPEGHVTNLMRMVQGRLIQTATGERGEDD